MHAFKAQIELLKRNCNFSFPVFPLQVPCADSMESLPPDFCHDTGPCYYADNKGYGFV